MKYAWSIREYREGDEEGILQLSKAVHPDRDYSQEKWSRWWYWMYKHNPAGMSKIWVAEHDSKIVGQYPLILVNLKVGDDVVKASQNIDLMTHPDYRYQGIFSKLAGKALSEAARIGINVTIGFPNDMAYPGHIKSGWFNIGTMQVMYNILNWRNVVKLKIGNRFLQLIAATGASLVFNRIFFRAQKRSAVEGLSINELVSFDERFNEFWNRIRNQSHIMVERSEHYLNWRYSTPNVNYSIIVAEKDSKISGYLVLRGRTEKDVKVIRIVDLVADSAEVMHCLVSRAVENCRQNKVDLINYSFIANRTYPQILKRNGFIPVTFNKGPLLCAYCSSQSISKEFLSQPGNWFVQLGDSDRV